MNYLITGGAGFIGSHLADCLIEKGHSVHVLDNLSTGSLGNVRHLMNRDCFELTIGNVLDYHTLEQQVAACDRVVHLAAAVGVRLVMEKPVETIVSNVQGTENVLKLSSYYDRQVLVASTSEVYGKRMETDDSISSLREDDDRMLGPTTKRRWAYACSKAVDEFLALAYYDEKDLPVVVARFFNTVGPRQTGRYGMVVPTFVEQALAGEPIRVFGDGEQTRCFTYVGDAVRAIVALLERGDTAGEVYNVGGDEEISINALAERVRVLTGSSSEIVHVPYEEVYGPGFEDMQQRTPDIGKLQRAIGYAPTHSVDDILRKVVAFFKKQRTASNGHAGVLEGEKAIRA